jgi:DNA repair exonuclease SbcCD nuclease subunit
MYRFLHLADCHLDAPLKSRKIQVARQLKQAQYDSLAKGIDFAIDQALDGILLAGDLLDHDQPSPRSLYFLNHHLTRLQEAKVPVFYVAGNHDPVYSLPQEIQDKMVVFPPDQVTVKALDNQVQIVGISHGQSQVTTPWLRAFPRKKRGLVVGVIHSMVVGVETVADKGPYMPSSQEEIKALGYDYLALGHIHQRQQVGDLPAYYPGSCQGLHRKETGPKGGLLVTLDQGETQVDFLPLAPLVFDKANLVLNPEMDITRVYESLQEKIQTLSPASLLDYGIQGEVNQTVYDQLGECLEQIEEDHGLVDLTWQVEVTLALEEETLLALSPVLKMTLDKLEASAYTDLEKRALKNDLLAYFKGVDHGDQ